MPHHMSPSSDSNTTMVTCSSQQQNDDTDSETSTTKEKDQRHKIIYHSSSSINSNSGSGSEEAYDKTPPSVILDFPPKHLSFVTPEKYIIEDSHANILNYSSSDKGNEKGIIEFSLSHSEKREYDNDNNGKKNSRMQEWYTIFSSGVTPFGKPTWPPVFIWIIIIMLFFVMSGELLLSKETAGEFLELKPLNYMLGPSIQVLIQTGARFPPCMRYISHMPPIQNYICINTTTAEAIQTSSIYSLLDSANETTATTNINSDNTTSNSDLIFEPSVCSLEDICGFGGFANPNDPDQAFRFFTPLFVHSGLVHWGLNLIVLAQLGFKLERLMSGWRFGVVYVTSGIFGNAFGANFATPTTPTLGCGAAVFGLMGCSFIDLALRWHIVKQPFRHLIKLIVFTILGFCILGILPGVDSFTNTGGLLAGLLIGISMVPDDKNRSRKGLLFLWTLRVLAFIILFISFISLLNNFYGQNDNDFCPYCRYILCLPLISSFCDQPT